MSISVNNLCLIRGNKQIFENLTFQSESRLINIKGRNGIGKSSLLLALSGLIPLQSGVIRIGNRLLSQKELMSAVGLSSAEIVTPSDIVCEHIIIYLTRRYQSAHYEMEDLLKGFDFDRQLDNTIAELSEGSFKKLTLIIALMKAQVLLLLDEPSNGLDIEATNFLLNNILAKTQLCTMITGHANTIHGQFTDIETINLDDHFAGKC